jgi:hypothetical protein
MLTKEEWKKMNADFTASTCQNHAEYLRLKLLGKPVTLKYRNKSLDDFLSQLILLREDFRDFSDQFIKAEKILPGSVSVDAKTVQTKKQELHAQQLLEKLDEIKDCINQFADRCLQELIL